ncbi:MAG: ribokinase [Chloroflexota bacterium]
MKPKIVVVGSANTDLVVKVKHLPAPGETVLGGNYMIAQGGKGANQAVAAARLGADVTLIARLGQDAFGNESFAAYQAEGIDTSYIFRDDSAPSGVALIMVNQAGENIISVAPGANSKLSPADILAAEAVIREADCVLTQLEIPVETVQAVVDLAEKHGVRTILNPAPAAPLPSELLAKVDVLTPNETEAAELAGNYSQAHAREAVSMLKTRFHVKNIVMTMGKNGAMIAGFQPKILPAYQVASVDTTGAGDAFNAGLAVALASGATLVNAVRFACAVAALSTTRPGAQPSMPVSKEVDDFVVHHPKT